MPERPFRIYKNRAGLPRGWALQKRFPPFSTICGFRSLGEAMDHAYKHYPWWP